MTNTFTTYSRNNGGRVLLLFLLFLLALYQFFHAGFPAFTAVCLIPFLVLFVYGAFKWRMFTFWMLFFVNYLIQMKDISASLPVPMSLPNEILEISLLAIAIVDARENPHFEKCGNLMLLALIIWCVFCTLEVLNDTCNLGIDIAAWYTGARLMAFQMLYIFLVFCIYISTPEILIKYVRIWAALSLFSVFWVWKQQTFGFTQAENIWMETVGHSTHILNAGTLTRYFSTFSDAANYGCNAAGTSVAFLIMGITAKLKKDKILFLVTSVLVAWGMFASGTRVALGALMAGLMVYIVLSKSIKIAIPFAISFALFVFILAFTNIGQGNQQIRRMRTAFNKNDASAIARDHNQEAMKKYMKEAPWGIGIGMKTENVPKNNKFYLMAKVPPDSEYVNIWIRTGKIGLTVFLITTFFMFVGACYIVMFRLKNKSLIGIGGGMCCAFVAIQLGAYGNQVLMQFPNGLIFYGGLSIVYILPYLEPAWIELENKRLAKQEERKRIKLEKKLAARV